MRYLILVGLIWLSLVLVISIFGTSELDRWWRSMQDEMLVRESGLVAGVCESTDWTEPWESDSRWESLERKWNLDLIPIYASGQPSDGLVEKDDPRPANNEWIYVEPGVWRVSREVSLSRASLNTHLDTAQSEIKGSGSSVVGVRITRIASQHSIHWLWYSLSAASMLIGLGLLSWVTWFIRSIDRQKHQSLTPLVGAVKSLADARKARLPEFTLEDEILSVQASMIRESVNRWLEELQQAIEQNELVLGNMLEGVVAVDEGSRVLLANKASVRLLGVAGSLETQRPLVELIRAPRLIAAMESVLQNGSATEDSFEFGTERSHLRVIARPMLLEGNRRGALLTIRDETLLRRIETVRRDFVANASHELKTPLSAIRAYAETLLMGANEDVEASNQFLNGILAQTDRINSVVNGMLQLAKVQSGSANLKRIRFDALQIIEACYRAADTLAKANNITLVKSTTSETLPMLGDPDAIETIVSNLLSNAIRYTPPGGRVTLTIFSSGDDAIFRVEDTGVGIGKEELDRIFERFYRVERSRTSSGTGLGLSIVKNLVDAHEGSISVKSELQVGSCFEVRMPIRLRSE